MPPVPTRRAALFGLAGSILALTGCSNVTSDGPASARQATPLSDVVTVSQPWCTSDGSDTLVQYVDTHPVPMRAAAAAADDAGPDANADGLPGCGSFSTFNVQQTTTTGSSPASTPYTADGGQRLLVAVQVADGTKDPVLTLRHRPAVTFAEDPDVLAEAPDAPDGRHWVGYRSTEFRFAKDETDAGDVVDAAVEIPRGADRPASNELLTTIAIGTQVTANGFGAEYPADRPVACDEDLASVRGHRSEISTTICPLQADLATGTVAPQPADATITPTDAAVAAPDQELPVAAGRTATVPFVVAQSGETPDAASMDLGATTSVPGGTASPAVSSVPWATAPVDPPVTTTTTLTATRAAPTAGGSTDVPVTVAVPAGTPSGTYEVTLRASDTGGSRTGVARIRVSGGPAAPAGGASTTPVAPAPPAPVGPAGQPSQRKPISVTVKLLRGSVVSRRTRRLHLGQVTCVRERGSGPCVVRSRVTSAGREIGRITVRVQPKSTGRVTLRLTAPALEKLIAKGARATTTVSAAGSDDVVRVTTVRAKAPRKRG